MSLVSPVSHDAQEGALPRDREAALKEAAQDDVDESAEEPSGTGKDACKDDAKHDGQNANFVQDSPEKVSDSSQLSVGMMRDWTIAAAH